MPLQTYDSKFGARTIREHALRNPSSMGDRTPPIEEVLVGPAVIAHVNHGRWIACCPCDGCLGAQLVSLERPVFFCTSCRNEAWDYKLLPVLIPDSRTAAQIDSYLSARPVPATRNWMPGESIADLRAENRAHGIRLSKR